MDNKGTAPGCEKNTLGNHDPQEFVYRNITKKNNFTHVDCQQKVATMFFPKLAEMKSITDLFTQG
jgi:hypothetical protein